MADITANACYTIENSFVSLSFPVQKNRLSGFTLTNAQQNLALTPADGTTLFSLYFNGALGKTKISASDLKILSASLDNIGEQQTLEVTFRPFRIHGCKLTAVYAVQLLRYDSFLQSTLTLRRENGKGEATLDHIDFAPFVLPQGSSGWSLPIQDRAHIGTLPLMLGQPFFVDHCFFGCAFPAARNAIRGGVAFAKRYYGKTVDVLIGTDGAFRSEPFVFGVAESPVFERVRAAFFAYIDKIARPARPRIQYNSWFDRMLDIDEQTLLQDIADLDKARNAAGCDALDSFVIDDGWNDYDADFWTFNEKFPNGLQPLARALSAVGASLGLWIGPRGGYNGKTYRFAKAIEEAGYGRCNKRSRDICVASDAYTEKLAAFMENCIREGSLTYWKIDGMALAPCRDKRHDHATGGKDDLYYYSDLWERWINLFERLHQAAGRPLFLNLTSFTQPSPWLLQWVQSVWIQNSDDLGRKKIGKGGCDADAALTYRDGRYYDFYAVRQFCFPPARLYHHDPIFGAQSKLKMTDEQFRMYLYAVLARGANLTEEYFGCGTMDENKWRICAAAERFAKRYRNVLQHAVLFGGDPQEGAVYGYAAFTPHEGILLIRNPADRPQSLTLPFDETLGVQKSVAPLPLSQLLPLTDAGDLGAYGYGDALPVSLAPYETKLLRFGVSVPVRAVRLRVKAPRTLEVTCDNFVFWDGVACASNPIETAEPFCDGYGVRLTFTQPFAKENALTLTGLTDPLRVPQTLDLRFLCWEDDLVRSGGLQGSSGFSVKITADPGGDRLLFSQNDVSVSLEHNRVLFCVGEARLSSASDVVDLVQLCAVREDSGVLKLYLNGKPDAGLLPVGPPLEITQAEPYLADPARTKLYCRALAYDEI